MFTCRWCNRNFGSLQALRGHFKGCRAKKEAKREGRKLSPPPTPPMRTEEKPTEPLYKSEPAGTPYPTVVPPMPQAFAAPWQMPQAPPQQPQPIHVEPPAEHARVKPQQPAPIVIRVEVGGKEAKEVPSPPKEVKPVQETLREIFKEHLKEKRKSEGWLEQVRQGVDKTAETIAGTITKAEKGELYPEGAKTRPEASPPVQQQKHVPVPPPRIAEVMSQIQPATSENIEGAIRKATFDAISAMLKARFKEEPAGEHEKIEKAKEEKPEGEHCEAEAHEKAEEGPQLQLREVPKRVPPPRPILIFPRPRRLRLSKQD